MALAEHENLIEALSAHASQKALAHGIRSRRSHGRLDNSCSHSAGSSVEFLPVLVVAIADDEPRADAEGRGVSQLLGHPSRGGLARCGDVHQATRAYLDNEKGKDWPKP